jgi:hypothetical protein
MSNNPTGALTWTPERDDELTHLRACGEYSTSQIAAKLGITPSAVTGRAYRLQLPRLTSSGARGPQRKPRVRLVVVPLPNEPKSLQLTTRQLQVDSCQWIAGDDQLHCGHQTSWGVDRHGAPIRLYLCAFHHAAAHQ